MQDRFDRGMKIRRSVLGDAHVDRAEAAKTELDADFQRYLTESVWGDLWSRPGLERRERSLVTVAILAALGRDEELALHLRATARTGATRQDLTEVLLHVAAYAGVPAANRAFAIAKDVLAESGAR